jgi:hypothetical protein
MVWRAPWAALLPPCFLCAVALARPARAEQLIIKEPGAHPSYTLELEPHVLLGFRELRNGPGVGLRATLPIVFNGFVSSINDSVGIGTGLDIDPVARDPHFIIPIVLQWNFWLSTHWSVFGEPGAAIVFGRGDAAVPWPFVHAGGRYHFSQLLALTLRVGYPDASVGLSLFF